MHRLERQVLLLFHCRTNTGYAIGKLERVFHEMAIAFTGSEALVHYAYTSLSGGPPRHLPEWFHRIYEFDPAAQDRLSLDEYAAIVRSHGIKTVFAFDLPLRAPILGALRRGGVKRIISYWGASISKPYPWYLRPFRKIQYLTAVDRPDHFIFESEGMREGAVKGSMIPLARTSVCRLGVDLAEFTSESVDPMFAHRLLNIPQDRKVVFFSGHMEERKGVAVLVKAMHELVCNRNRVDLHLVIAGNQPGEEKPFLRLISGSRASEFVSFVGYRSEMPSFHRSAYVGAIASTGWDSFTLSAVEMAASGLPLIVSRLPGLEEAVVDGETGFLFTPGDHCALADALEKLADSPALRDSMAHAARMRAISEFSRHRQVTALSEIVSEHG